MLSLHEELIILISTFLNNKEKIVLASLTKSFTMFQKKFIYHDKIDARKIMNVPYNNNFTYVVYTHEPDYFGIPPFVTHLYIDDWFNEPLDELPKSLKFIRISESFDNKINIPSSVTHMLFDEFAKYPYTELPPNVTHIMLEYYYHATHKFPDTIKYLFANKIDASSNIVSSSTTIIYYDYINYHTVVKNFSDSASLLE